MAAVPGSGPRDGFADAEWNITLDLTQVKASEMATHLYLKEAACDNWCLRVLAPQ